MKRFEVCYPNYSKKAITFTIDDGDIRHDAKLLSILSPAGIRGTFNLTGCRLDRYTIEQYRETYRGSEIANHCKAHPYCFADGAEYAFSDEPFSHECSDVDKLYPHPNHDGLYYIHFARGWRLIARPELYCKLVDMAKAEIEDVFGNGTVRDFVWPFGEQKSEMVMSHLQERGYRSVRRTGATLDKDAFNIPKDRMSWSYNAVHLNLLQVAKKYDDIPDDGELKMFAFGVHSVDFERSGNWNDLCTFATLYGNRPTEFWYATVGEIFDYQTATMRLSVVDDYIINRADTTIYLKLSGSCITLEPGCRIPLK